MSEELEVPIITVCGFQDYRIMCGHAYKFGYFQE